MLFNINRIIFIYYRVSKTDCISYDLDEVNTPRISEPDVMDRPREYAQMYRMMQHITKEILYQIPHLSLFASRKHNEINIAAGC